MNKCRTCKFFEPEQVEHSTTHGWCHNSKLTNDVQSDADFTDTLIYFGIHEESADCRVGHDFGCIHHQTK